MVRLNTFEEALDATPDPAERSRIALEAVAESLRRITSELHWIEAQLYSRHEPAELRRLLERYAAAESSRAAILQAVREFE